MSDTLTAEILADLIYPQNVAISKDGTRVIYVAQRATRVDSGPTKSSIWLAETSKENSARQLTPADHNDKSPAFSPDGSSAAFMSDRAEAGKDNDLYLMSLQDPLNPTRLTTSSEHGKVSGFKWTLDGTSIIFNAQPKEDPKADVKVYGEDVRYHNLWIVDIETKKIIQLTHEKADVNIFDLSPDGGDVGYVTRDEPNLNSQDWGQDIKTVNIKDHATKLLYRLPCRTGMMSWLDKNVVVEATYGLEGVVHSKALYSIQDGKADRIAYGERNDLTHLQSCWDKCVCLVQNGMKDSLQLLDDVIFETTEGIKSYDVTWQEDSAIIVLVKDSVGVPPEVYSVAKGELRQLSQHGQRVAKLEIGTCVLIEEEENGTPYDGTWCVPTSLQSNFKDRKPSPTVVICKGGPYGRHNNVFDGSHVANITSYLLAQGYLVLQPNYTGGSSHGDHYARAVFGRPDLSYDDVVWHVKKGVADGRIDPDRVAITGWSQGGYLTYLAVTRPETFHFKAGIACAGVSDLYAETVTSDLTTIEGALMGFKPWDKDSPELKMPIGSPIHYAHRVTTPLLILHGEEDDRVTIQNAQMFALAMKEHRKEFEMALYPREGHGASVAWERAHIVDLLNRIGKFFKKHLD